MRALTIGLIALIITAAVPAVAGQAELQADPSWTMIADGVFERLDDSGMLHRRAIGREGLQWDIARTRQLIDWIANDPNLEPKHRLEQLKSLGAHLESLERIDPSTLDSVFEPTEKVLCTPTTVSVRAQTTPYSGACVYGALAKVEFDGRNCPGLTADASVYAISTGTITGVDSDSDTANDLTNFTITAHAMSCVQICSYSSAVLLYDSTYLSDHYESPDGCYDCPNCS